MCTNSLLRSIGAAIIMLPFLLKGEVAPPPSPAVDTPPAPAAIETAEGTAAAPASPLFAAEEQVSFDEEGKIRVIDRGLRTRFGLLPGIDGFVQALLFKKGGTYELAVTTEKEATTVDVRMPLTVAQFIELRAKVTAATAPVPVIAPQPSEKPLVAAPPPPKRSAAIEDEADGFAPFLAYTTIWAGGYGAMMPFVFGGYDVHWALYPGISLLSAGTAFTAGYFLGHDAKMTRGMAFASAEGAFRGGADGALLLWLIAGNLDHGDDESWELKSDTGLKVDTYGRLMLGATMFFSMGQYALGMWYADRYELTGGEARILGFGSLLGYVTMMELSATIFGGLFSEDNDLVRITPAMLLAGGVAGLFLGDAANGWDHYTEGDASLLQTTAVLGTYLPTSIALAAESNDSRVYSGLALLGTVGGVIGGYYLLRGLDFSNLDAFVIDLGTLAGGLATTGIGWLCAMETEQYLAIPVASSIGTLAGFGLMYYLYRERGLRQAEGGEKTSWHFQLNPAGIAAAVSGSRAPSPRNEEELRLLRETPAASIASFEYRW
jgi:hypothetical protein